MRHGPILRPCLVPSGALGAGGGEKRKPGVSVTGSTPRGLLQPGDRLVVRFEDDMDYGHERLIQWTVFGDGDFVVLTPDRDLYSESEGDWKEAILMTGWKAYPARGMPPELVQFELPMEDSEVSAQIKLGRTEASARRRDEAARVVAPSPRKAFTWQGKALKIPGVTWADEVRARVARPKFRVRRKAPPQKPDTSLAAPKDSVWLISAPGFAGHAFGTEVVFTFGLVVFRSHGIFAVAEGNPVALVKLADVGGLAVSKATGWEA